MLSGRVPDALRRAGRFSTQPLIVLLTGAAFAVLYDADLVGHLSLWSLFGLLGTATLASTAVTKRWGTATTGARLHARIAVRMAATTWVIYAIGWGPTLAVGYLVPAAEDLELSGSAAWRPALGWSLGWMACGQAAIALHAVPTYVARDFAQGLGLLSALGLAFVLHLLGAKTAANERSQGELREAFQDLEKVNAELERNNRLKTEFVAIASHELRTPLTSISGFARVLVSRWEGIPDAERLSHTERIASQARRLDRLVEDLLSVSRIDAGVVVANPEELDIGHAVATAVAEGASAGGDVRVTCDGDDGTAVIADPDHLHQMLLNYLTNARKYGADPIEIEAVCADDWVDVRVLDRGPGVPPDFVPRLFDRFTRVEGNSGGERGAGLGLAIVDGLAQANGGRAWYQPNIPQGSCFVLRLRRAGVVPSPSLLASGRPPPQRAAPREDAPHRPLPGRR
jgi:signal transduction histidine kinase